MPELKIKDLNLQNRPRERLLEKGSSALSDFELLAIVLRTGGKNASALQVSQEILSKYNSLKSILEAEIIQLTKERYLGISKVTTLKAISEIAKRAYLGNNNLKIAINTPHEAFDLVKKELFGKKQEILYLLNLDTRKRVISKEIISLGSVNETLIPVREILHKAISCQAVNIILVHNHPSNDPTPSREDFLVTEKLSKACNLVGISLLDHIITADNNYVSLKSHNMGQENKNLTEEGR